MSRQKNRARRVTVAALFYPLPEGAIYNRIQHLKKGPAPYIRIRGHYLKNWGFSIGDSVELSSIAPGVLVLRKIRTAEAIAPAAVLMSPNDTERHEITL